MLNLFAFEYIFAELVLFISSLVLVLFGLIGENIINKTKIVSVIGIAILSFCAYLVFNDNPSLNFIGFNGLVVSNRYVLFAKFIVLISAIVSILMSMGYVRVEKKSNKSNHRDDNNIYLKFEYVALVLFSVLGMLVLLSANDFMSMYVGLELQSLAIYVLISFNKKDIKCSEAALKYFILSAIASGIMLYGISLIYGFSGTTNFTVFADFYASYSGTKGIPVGVMIGMVLVISGFCFKIAAVPFHMWSPDVYQGAPLPVTLFLSTTSKVAAILFIANLLMDVFDVWVDSWQQVIKCIAILSLFVGSLGALVQSDIKRLLAYSSIAHVGFILVGLSANSVAGLQSVMVYACIYIFMNMGIFAFVAILQNRGDMTQEENFDLSIFAGLSKTSPVFALCIAILLLSLAGIPPFAGFLAKFYVLNAAIAGGAYVVATLGIVSAVISTFYYLKIIKIMYFDSANDVGHDSSISWCSLENIVIVSVSTTFNVALIFSPSGMYSLVGYAAV